LNLPVQVDWADWPQVASSVANFIEDWEREYLTLVNCNANWLPEEIVPLVPAYDWFHDPFFAGDKYAFQ